jgi:hypothetical protein
MLQPHQAVKNTLRVAMAMKPLSHVQGGSVKHQGSDILDKEGRHNSD